MMRSNKKTPGIVVQLEFWIESTNKRWSGSDLATFVSLGLIDWSVMCLNFRGFHKKSIVTMICSIIKPPLHNCNWVSGFDWICFVVNSRFDRRHDLVKSRIDWPPSQIANWLDKSRFDWDVSQFAIWPVNSRFDRRRGWTPTYILILTPRKLFEPPVH